MILIVLLVNVGDLKTGCLIDVLRVFFATGMGSQPLVSSNLAGWNNPF